MSKSNRTIRSNSSRLLLIAVLTVAAILLALLVKKYSDNGKSIPEEQLNWENSLEKLDEQSQQHATTPAPDTTDNLPNGQATETPQRLSPCQETAANLDDFFKHLDKQEYIAAYEFSEPVASHINKLIIKLLSNPPIISKETDDLFTVLKNTAHFYRILGHKDLSLIKDILTYEHDDIEYLMALFYKWSQTTGDCQQNVISINLPVTKTYEYASFFLNTLGGQSYLFRRESNIRILTKYYCTLILNQAVKESLNSYNIDLKYTIDSTIEDLKNANSLENQEEYIGLLKKIKIANK